MSTILLTCAALMAAWSPTHPVATAPDGATIRITTDCPADRPLLIRSRTTPLVIDGTGRRFPGGLWFLGVDGVIWRGGTVEAAGGMRGLNRAGYAVTVEQSKRLRVEGATITNAYRGLVTIRSTGPLEIVGNRFTGLGGDGINFTGDPAFGSISGLIEGNSFSDLQPLRSTCTFPDGTVESPANRTDCENRGGTYRDGDHPDCVQMWGALEGVVVRGNRFLDGVNCQGITTFGTKLDPIYRNIKVIWNELHLIDLESNGIAVGNCTDCEISNNRVRGANAYIRTYDPIERVTLCGNSIETTHPGKIAASGVQPCPAPPTLQQMVVKVIIPPGVEVVVVEEK